MKEVQAQLDQNLLGQLCHGSPGLDSGLFSAAARPGQRLFSYLGANVALENRD